MRKDFYKYPKTFETKSYVMERRTNGLHVSYVVKLKETKKEVGFIEIDESRVVKEISGWRDDNHFQSAKEEITTFLKKFF